MNDLPPPDVLPFPVSASSPGVWRRDTSGEAVLATAPGHTDFYLNPAGAESADAATMLNAATLLGTPPAGDFQLSARVGVDFQTRYDAGVLMLWIDTENWAKFCFELSPAGQPMVVSVVTRGVSDDANAFVVAEQSVWLRVSRVDQAYAFHASTDGAAWQLVRVFTLGDDLTGHQVGLEVQSPTGDGCTVTFDQIHFSEQRLADLRDGS